MRLKQYQAPTPDTGSLRRCRQCGKENLPGCRLCKFCRYCKCRCTVCSGCEKKHPQSYICRWCKRCRAPKEGLPGCTCRKRPFFIPQDHTGLLSNIDIRKMRLKDPLARTIGVELEFSRIPRDRDDMPRNAPRRIPGYETCAWTADGSVTRGGMEMVCPPVPGYYFPSAISQLMGALTQLGGVEVDGTCGYHVHVDATRVDPYQLRRIILLYHQLEDVFYSLVRPGRHLPVAKLRGGIPEGGVKAYCAKWDTSGIKPTHYRRLALLKTPSDIRRWVVLWLYPGHERVAPGGAATMINMAEIRRNKYQPCRYTGLNLHTWFERGTVEFRHHEGTADLATITNWALFCGWFVELACQASDTDVAGVASLEDLLALRVGKYYIPAPLASWLRDIARVRSAEHTAWKPTPVTEQAITTSFRVSTHRTREIAEQLDREQRRRTRARETGSIIRNDGTRVDIPADATARYFEATPDAQTMIPNMVVANDGLTYYQSRAMRDAGQAPVAMADGPNWPTPTVPPPLPTGPTPHQRLRQRAAWTVNASGVRQVTGGIVTVPQIEEEEG